MSGQTFIAGDWGTTSLRLYLCRGDEVLERLRGPGVTGILHSPEEALFDLIAPWDEIADDCPIFLSGMVGSNLGWVTAPYADCPAGIPDLALRRTALRARGRTVFIAPGLMCKNALGVPDTMRGEETQIAGLLALHPELQGGRHLLCLPGTHTKWAYLEDGKIWSFLTAMTGELFALLSRQSVLVPKDASTTHHEGWDSAFAEGLEAARSDAGSDSLHLLFGVRARQLMGDLAPAAAAPFLSGLLVGRDVLGALKLLAADITPDTTVHIVGEPTLNRSYGRALEANHYATRLHDGGDMVLAGLRALFLQTLTSSQTHA